MNYKDLKHQNAKQIKIKKRLNNNAKVTMIKKELVHS